ncbi:MAG: ZIP family metal transporter, partial [Brevefilum fermentans]
MIAIFEQFSPIIQALMGTLFTWFMTAFGASLIFLTKEVNQRLLDGLLGFASGVMIAASFWSLLEPAIELSHDMTVPVWVPAAVGFLLGGLFLFLVDKLLPHLHMGMEMGEAEGLKSSWRRSVLLITAITLHNIPEGLAV